MQLSRGSLKAKDTRSLSNNEGEEVKKQAHQNHTETISFIGSSTFPELASSRSPTLGTRAVGSCTPALREGKKVKLTRVSFAWAIQMKI